MTLPKTFFFLYFSVLDTMYQWSMMKNIHSPNLLGIGSWGPEIWLQEYLICPTEISVNWPGSKQNFMNQANLRWFQWGKLGIHAAISQATINQFMSNFVCEGFSSCSTEIWSWKCWNAKKKIWWCHTSVLCRTRVPILEILSAVWASAA